MKDQWQKLELKIDALSLRERAMAFAIGALLVTVVINTLIISPLFARQKQLAEQVKLEQQQIASMQAEIQLRVSTHDADPDAANRMRLQQLKQQSAEMRSVLTGMQSTLVPPNKMAALLEDLLRKDGHLQLRSLKTLPVSLLNETADKGVATAGTVAVQSLKGKPGIAASADAVYKHGVEITIEGSYADLLGYLARLEALPSQLFWAGVRLDVEAYPKSSLTLTLFTLSLDKKWLNI